MFNRIIRIAAALGALCLWAGCARIADLTPEAAPAGAIAFDASSLLLSDDATKDTAPKNVFSDGDEFFVFGSKTLDGIREDVFDGTLVRLVSSTWGYDNTRFWDTQSSRYDFLAISGPRSTAGIECNPVAGGGPVTARVSYNAVLGECDLMAACSQRTSAGEGNWVDGKRNPVKITDPVKLRFHHLLSAVSVKVSNDRWNPGVVTLQSWHFQNLAVAGTVTLVEDDSAVPGFSWETSAYSTSTSVLGSNFVEPIILYPGDIYPDSWTDSPEDAPVVNMMIPQDLTLSCQPVLVLTFTFEEPDPGNPWGYSTCSRTIPVPLNGIMDKNTDLPVTRWKQGHQYEYRVIISAAGSVDVKVVASPWDVTDVDTSDYQIR